MPKSLSLRLAIFYALSCCFAQADESTVGEEPNKPTAIEQLSKDLFDSNVEKRRDAAHALSDLGPQAAQAVPDLVKAIRDDRDPQVWFESVQAIARIGPDATHAIPVLIDELDSRDDQQHYRAAHALGHIGLGALDDLTVALTDDSPTVRRGAAMAIAWMRQDAEPAIPSLIKRLGDDDEQVVQEVAKALGQIGRAAESPAVELLATDNRNALLGGVIALRRIGAVSPAAIQGLMDNATHENVDIRSNVILGLIAAKVEDEKMTNVVVTALQDTDPQVRDAAIAALMKMGPRAKQAIPNLVTLLDSDQPPVRNLAAYGLGALGPMAEPAVPALIAVLSKSNDDLAVVRALSQIGPAAVPSLLAATTNPEIPRASLANALASMGSVALGPLVSALDDEDANIRSGAVAAIGAMDGRPESAVESLNQAIQNDESPDVRIAALEALAQCGPPAKNYVETVRDAFSNPNLDIQAASLAALIQIDDDTASVLERVSLALKNDNVVLRRTAIRGIAQLGALAKPLAEELPAALQDSDAGIRAAAATAIAQVVTTNESIHRSLIEALADSDRDVKLNTIAALGQLRVADSAAEISKTLTSDDTQVVHASVTALGKLGDQATSAIDSLGELVTHTDEAVRGACVTALVEINEDEPKIIPILVLALNDEQWSVRQRACAALGEVGSEAVAAIPILFKLLSSEEDSEDARNALRRIDNVSPELIPVLLETLQSDSRRARFYAVYYLGKLGPDAKEALPVLRALDDGDSSRFRGSIERAIKSIESDSDDE